MKMIVTFNKKIGLNQTFSHYRNNNSVQCHNNENTVDSRYLEYSVSQTFWYLERMSWSLGKQQGKNYSISQTLDISNSFSEPLESSRYRESTVVS